MCAGCPIDTAAPPRFHVATTLLAGLPSTITEACWTTASKQSAIDDVAVVQNRSMTASPLGLTTSPNDGGFEPAMTGSP
jgi:hypothetical protein